MIFFLQGNDWRIIDEDFNPSIYTPVKQANRRLTVLVQKADASEVITGRSPIWVYPEIPRVKEIGNKISKPKESAPPLFISPLFPTHEMANIAR
jgi:hypothetical protein